MLLTGRGKGPDGEFFFFPTRFKGRRDNHFSAKGEGGGQDGVPSSLRGEEMFEREEGSREKSSLSSFFFRRKSRKEGEGGWNCFFLTSRKNGRKGKRKAATLFEEKRKGGSIRLFLRGT